MKTLTVSLSDEEFQTLCEVSAAMDPCGSVKPTSVAKGCLVEGLARQAARFSVPIVLGSQIPTDVIKRYLSKIGK